MPNQSPPTVTIEVPTEGQWAKNGQLNRDQARKNGVADKATMQFVLEDDDFATGLGQLYANAAAKHRLSIPLRDRPPFLTTKVGTFATVEAMREALEAAGVNVSDWASEMMARSEFSDRIVTEERDVQFVEAAVLELGEATGQDFSGGATIAQIYAAARQLNWETCEVSDAINVRLATLDQEKGWMYVSTDPGIPDSNGGLDLFSVVRNEGDLWLSSDCGCPDDFCSSHLPLRLPPQVEPLHFGPPAGGLEPSFPLAFCPGSRVSETRFCFCKTNFFSF